LSRLALIAAACAFLVLSVAPLLFMFARVETGDLAAILQERTLWLFLRTLTFGCACALLAVLIGVPFGFLVARTDLPFAAALRSLGSVPILLPPLLIAMTWSMLSGLRGAPAATLVLAASTFPLVAVFTAHAARRIDARREEAARLVGGLGAVVRMEWPLLRPAALTGACLAFALAVNDFAVPDYVSSVGPKFNVYAAEIFASWSQSSAPGRAVAAALPLIAISVAALLPALWLRRRGSMTTFGGDFEAPPPLALGAWRWPCFAFCLCAIALAALLPLFRLVYEAGGGPRGFALSNLPGAFGRALELARADLRNSLVLSLGAAAAVIAPALVLGHALERGARARWLEPLALLPIVVPAILFGIGVIAAWNHPSLARFYDGPGMVVVLLAGRFLAFPILIATSAVAALDPRLEEAAELAGAGPLRRMAGIVAPCLAPALVGSFLLVFVLSMRELDAAILVPAANHTGMFRVFNAVHFGRDDFVAAMALMLLFLIFLPALIGGLLRLRLSVLP
jgi:iron(III) transport system permease protein